MPVKELNDLEIKYIKKYNAYKRGYNSTKGGDGRQITTNIEEKEFIKIYKSGCSYKDMANYFEVCKATIGRTAKKLGLSRKINISKEDLLNLQHKTNIEIARELGVSPATITRRFKEYSIERGKGCSNHLNPQNQNSIDIPKDKLKKLKDKPVSELSDIFNCCKKTIYKRLDTYGLRD